MEKIQYCKWVHFNTGLEFADVFIEIYEGDYKLHVYNICCQHSKLTYTKQNLKENEEISVSTLVKTTKINKRMKFRAHNLAMRLLHYTLLHVTLRKNCLVQNMI